MSLPGQPRDQVGPRLVPGQDRGFESSIGQHTVDVADARCFIPGRIGGVKADQVPEQSHGTFVQCRRAVLYLLGHTHSPVSTLALAITTAWLGVCS